jgi:drug/metabolite transporter (DMT)-like permease
MNVGNFLLMVASIATTAICWGVYGPVLHNGQAAMAQGRLRPLICVGVSYFLVAIVVPLALIWFAGWENEEKFGFNMKGIVWSLAGGAAGAIGALGIVMAFTYGGTPARVMPIVFGMAPVINTLYSMWQNKSWDQMSPFYAAGIMLSIAGAVTVLMTAPPPKKHAPTKEEVVGKSERAAEVASMTSSSNALANQKLAEELAKAEAAQAADENEGASKS